MGLITSVLCLDGYSDFTKIFLLQKDNRILFLVLGVTSDGPGRTIHWIQDVGVQLKKSNEKTRSVWPGKSKGVTTLYWSTEFRENVRQERRTLRKRDIQKGGKRGCWRAAGVYRIEQLRSRKSKIQFIVKESLCEELVGLM